MAFKMGSQDYSKEEFYKNLYANDTDETDDWNCEDMETEFREEPKPALSQSPKHNPTKRKHSSRPREQGWSLTGKKSSILLSA